MTVARNCASGIFCVEEYREIVKYTAWFAEDETGGTSQSYFLSQIKHSGNKVSARCKQSRGRLHEARITPATYAHASEHEARMHTHRSHARCPTNTRRGAVFGPRGFKAVAS